MLLKFGNRSEVVAVIELAVAFLSPDPHFREREIFLNNFVANWYAVCTYGLTFAGIGHDFAQELTCPGNF